MKLPDITYNLQAQNLAKKSPFLPVSKARTKAMGAAALGVAGQAVHAIGTDVYEKDKKMREAILADAMKDAARIQAKKIKFNTEIKALGNAMMVDDAKSRLQKKNNQLVIDNANRKSYSNNELPEEVQQFGSNGEAIDSSASLVQADYLRSKRYKMVEEEAGSIQDPVSALDFKNGTSKLIEKQYINDKIRDLNKQRKERAYQQLDMIEAAQDARNWSTAKDTAKNFIDPSKRAGILDDVMKNEQTAPANDAMRDAHLPGMELELGKLMTNAQKYFPNLSAIEQRALATMLRGNINAVLSKQTTAMQASYAKASMDAKETMKRWDTGLRTDVDFQGEYDRFQDIQARLNPKDHKTSLELTRSYTNSGEFRRIATSRAGTMGDMIAGYQTKALETGDTDDMWVASRSKQIAPGLIEAQKNDITGYSLKYGITDPIGIDITSPNSSPENTEAYMRAAEQNRIKTNEHFATNDAELMSDGKMTAYAGKLASLKPAALLKEVEALKRGAPNGAYTVTDRLQDPVYGISGVMVAAEIHMQNPNDPEVNNILKGRQYMYNNPGYFKAVKNDFEQLVGPLGIVINDKNRFLALREAIKYDYIHSILGPGSESKNLVLEDVDETLLSESINRVINLQNVDGSNVEAFDRNQPKEQMQHYVEGIYENDDLGFIYTPTDKGRERLTTLGIDVQTQDLGKDGLLKAMNAGLIEYSNFGSDALKMRYTPTGETLKNKDGNVSVITWDDRMWSEIQGDMVDIVQPLGKPLSSMELTEKGEAVKEAFTTHPLVDVGKKIYKGLSIAGETIVEGAKESFRGEEDNEIGFD